jgi:hypothetical protein
MAFPSSIGHNRSTNFGDTAIIAARLLRLRLRWYAISTARLLLRRWQALALIVGVASAAGTTPMDNLAMFARPLLGLLAPGHGIAWRFAHLMVLLLACAAWAGMQRRQIEGGAFMAYAASLPFSPRQRRRVDLAVLVLADTPLLVIAGAALIVVAAHGAAAARQLLLIDVVLLALGAQLAVLERRLGAWAGVTAGALVLAASQGRPLLPLAALLVGAVTASALVFGPWRRPRRRLAPIHIPMLGWPASLLRRLAGRHAPALQVPLTILVRERRDETLTKALLAAAIAGAALGLVLLFDGDGRSFATVLIAQALVALTLGGMFRGLQMGHRAGIGFSGALPLARHWHRRFDLAAVLACALPFLGALAALAMAAGVPALRALAGAASYAVLLCALRAPAVFSERHAVVLATLLTGCWCAATIACLT